MSMTRHRQREKKNDTGYLFAYLARVGSILVLTIFIIGCVRAKPPRTVAVPESLEQRRANAESASTQSVTSQAATSPSPATPMPRVTASLSPTIPTLTTTPFPTTTVEIPTIGPTTSSLESTPHPPGEVVHLVKSGETLYTIAKKYDTTVLTIMDRNDLPYSNAIYVNQRLVIPTAHKPSGSPTPYTIEHVVQEGESLAQLARTYRTTLSDIIEENPHLRDANNLSPGIRLVITVGTAPPVRVHVVSPGQSLSAIARRYGVGVETLVRANGLRTPNTINVGQKLVIP